MQAGCCYIVGAGKLCARGLQPASGDLLIAADGGLKGLMRLHLRPRLVIGDMDSYRQPVRGLPLLRFPVRKDDTDISLAVRLGRQWGYRRFRLYGATGGPREDHFIANMQLMAGLSRQGLSVRITAPSFELYAVTDGELCLQTKPGQIISVFSHSADSRGVSLQGLSYESRGLHLCSAFPLGVSNQATGAMARIGVTQGTLLVYQQEDARFR
jgi:thiamine pyrophosphokinase